MLVVTTSEVELECQAKLLAEELHLPFMKEEEMAGDAYLVRVSADRLSLAEPSAQLSPISVDFLTKQMRYRCQRASLRRELVARALGLKHNTCPRIVDATAGLGQDSFILACLGFDVWLIERSPVIYALLIDGMRRAAQDDAVAPIISRMHGVKGDAITWLGQQSHQPDIIYLDPMFPRRTKSALSKKEMRIFHDVVGEDLDANALFEVAITCAAQRVVVKRPRLAAALMGRRPTYSILGSSNRFDIYVASS